MILTSSRDGSCSLRLNDSYYYETEQIIDNIFFAADGMP